MIETTLIACMLVAVPFEALIDAETVLDVDGFGNVAGGAQNRVSKATYGCFTSLWPCQHDHCRTGVTMT